MSNSQICKTVAMLLEWEAIGEEAKAEAEKLREELKREMVSRDTQELIAGPHIIRWTSVLSQRFDATAFKKHMPEIYKRYLKQISSRRFSIA